jgi:hypothetical protein
MASIAYMYELERQVAETFRVANAVTPQTAIVPPQFPRYDQRSIFKRFSKKRALVPTADGRVWLDESRFAEYMQTRARLLAGFAVAVVIITIIAIAAAP